MPHFVTLITDKAQQWVEENVIYEDWQLLGSSIAVDSRMIGDIIETMEEEGFEEDVDFTIYNKAYQRR